MTSDEILTFLSLADTKNFSKTADILFASQSTISARIKTLEAQLGQPLFLRNTKSVELTAAGESFLNYALEINRLIEESKRSSQAMGRFRQRLSIAAPESYWLNLLFPALDNYFDENSDTAFELMCTHSELVLQGLLANKNDIGIICFYMKHPNLETVLLKESPIILTAATCMKLPKAIFSPATFNSFPFINMDWGDSFNDWLHKTFFTGVHAFDIEKVSLYLKLLLSGKGVGFVPKRIAQPYLSSGELREIPYAAPEEAPCEITYLVYPKKKAEALCPIIKRLQDYSVKI